MRSFFASLLCVFALGHSARAQTYGPWRALGRFDFEHAKAPLGEVLAPEKPVKGGSSLFENPDFALAYKGMAGEQIGWKLLGDAFATNALDCGEFDLNVLVPPPAPKAGNVDNAVVYLHRGIESDRAQELAVWAGADDSLRLWLNGKLLVDAHHARALAVQDHFVKLQLRAGPNHLVAKVGNNSGAFQFRMRAWEKIPQAAINEAIDRGCEFLIRHQLLDGSWGAWEEWGGGHAAFCAYTLLKCGVARSHPTVRKALAFVRDRELETVYSISCAILALEAADDEGDRGLLEDLTARLVGMQNSVGLYDYPVYPNGDVPPVDMSNTLYAALALRAAKKAGVEVPEAVWAKLASGTLRCAEPAHEVLGDDGQKRRIAGFGYRIQEHAFGSTTTGGLSVLAICEELGGRSLPGGLKGKIATAKEQALAWIDEKIVWSVNPEHGNGHHYFWVYGLERVGALCNVERFGGVDWYWDGAAYLLKGQAANGSWNAHGWAYHEFLDTCLALLFLKKATAARLSGEATARPGMYESAALAGRPRLRVTGDVQLTMWISELDDGLFQRAATGDALDVERVEYFARLEGEPDSERKLGTVKGEPCKRTQLQRFALRHAFDRRGKWQVSARLFLRPPAAKPAAPAGPPDDKAPPPAAVDDALTPEGLLRFDTLDLVVPVEIAAGVLRLDYAGDLSRNLLFDARAKFAASSQNGDGETPERLCDGSLEKRWRCQAGDEKPWVRLTLDRPIKAERFLLTHALPRPQHSDTPRATKVVVVVNQKEQFALDLNPDVLEKTTLEFGAVLAVKELEVRILECRDRKAAGEPVGFAEFELQRKR
jgi:hypothetical protein